MMETFELFQNNRSASKYLPLTVNGSTKLSPLLKQLLERKTRSDLIDLFFSDLPKAELIAHRLSHIVVTNIIG